MSKKDEIPSAEKVQVSFRVPEKRRRILQATAAERGIKVQALVEEAVALWFAEHGKTVEMSPQRSQAAEKILAAVTDYVSTFRDENVSLVRGLAATLKLKPEVLLRLAEEAEEGNPGKGRASVT